MLIHIGDGGGVLGEEGVHRLRVLLHEVAPGHHAAHGEGAGGPHVLPHVVEIDGVPHIGVLHHDAGGGGDREHAQIDPAGGHEGRDLLAGLPLDGHVLAGGEAALLQQIVEHVLGVGALVDAVDGLARQIGHGVDRVAVLQDVEHAQGVEGQQPDAARLVIEGGRQVGGDCGDVQLAVVQLGHNIGGRVGADGILIVVDRLPRVAVGEQLGRSHAGGAVEQAQTDLHTRSGWGLGHRGRALRRRRCGLRCGGLLRPGLGGAPRSQAQHQGQAQAQGQQLLFHVNLFLS